MSVNPFEEQASEYLRYNGFFLIRGFVIHFEDANAQEIDFVGVRLPESVEQTVYSDGQFSAFVFKDDGEKLDLSDTPEIILVVAEVTESKKGIKVEERIEKLRDPIRIGYALRRLGVIEKEDIGMLLHGKSIDYSNGVRARLLQLLFVLNKRMAMKYREKNSDITFITQNDVLSFIGERAKINIKERARAHLPRWLHNCVDKLLHR